MGRLRTYCLSLPDATETFPLNRPSPSSRHPAARCSPSLRPSSTQRRQRECDPDIGEALRAEYESIVPGYHLNKRHWITVTLGGDVPDRRIRQLIEDS